MLASSRPITRRTDRGSRPAVRRRVFGFGPLFRREFRPIRPTPLHYSCNHSSDSARCPTYPRRRAAVLTDGAFSLARFVAGTWDPPTRTLRAAYYTMSRITRGGPRLRSIPYGGRYRRTGGRESDLTDGSGVARCRRRGCSDPLLFVARRAIPADARSLVSPAVDRVTGRACGSLSP